MGAGDTYYGTNLFELSDAKGPAPKTKVAQYKEVDPQFEEQLVTPDAEYFYLSSVRVGAMPSGLRINPYDLNPEPLSDTAFQGISNDYSRGDHVHPFPSPSDIGAASLEELYDAFPTDISFGEVASFPDGANGLPVKSLLVNIKPVQTGSGDPAPDNVRPITGHTGLSVRRSGGDPVSEQVIPIVFPNPPGTVYFGTYNLLTGLLTVTWAKWTNFHNWSKHNSGYFYKQTGPNKKPGQTNVISDFLKTVRPTQIASVINATCGRDSDGTIFVRPPDTVTTAAGFETFMSGHYVIYELATPETYQLITNELSTLFGQNSIWSDAGDVEVVYRADPTLFIHKLTDPDNNMIADANIASGKYFIVGNTLYLSTASIAAGERIVPGTNCTATNLAAALNAINT